MRLPVRYRPNAYSLTWVAYPAAQGAWTNMPLAEALYFGTDRSIKKADLSNYRQVRLLVMRSGVAGAAAAKMYLKYKTGVFSSNVANYSQLGTSSVEVAVATASTPVDSGWIDLAAGAIADDVWLAITGDGGDGVADPQFGEITAEFR